MCTKNIILCAKIRKSDNQYIVVSFDDPVCQINVTNFYRKRLKEREPISQRTFLKNECCQAKKKRSRALLCRLTILIRPPETLMAKKKISQKVYINSYSGYCYKEVLVSIFLFISRKLEVAQKS